LAIAFNEKALKDANGIRWTRGRRLIMNRAIGLLSAAGIGAGMMYLFDPGCSRFEQL
jgi:hypothetical protein